MAKVSRVWAREILDSRGMPTIETVVMLDSGQAASASVPSGSSVGKNEALELRDNDEKRFFGKGVLKAISNVTEILGPAIIGMDPTNLAQIDQKLIGLDATPNKSKLGANSILSVSLACAKVAALENNLPLYVFVHHFAVARGASSKNPPSRIPTPIFNMINGGIHGAGNLDFQEFQVIPATSKPYFESLRMGAEIYHFVEQSLIRRGAIHSVGDEGGFAPNLFTNADALEIFVEAIENSGYQMGQDVFLGLDVAASTFFKDGKYSIRDRSNPLNTQSLIEYYGELNKEYRLTLLEDPLDEEDWEGWSEIMRRLGGKLLVVGDDLLTTNPKRVEQAAQLKACNSILVKPNQIGTITETVDVVKLARGHGWKIITSHRSGETNDWFIADFAVGLGSDFIKFGAPSRGERTAKYNRLLSIDSELSAARKEG